MATIADMIEKIHDEGATAQRAGTAIDACPYPRPSFEANAWREGWMTAAREQMWTAPGGDQPA